VAQHRKEHPADTLEELASLGERLMQWVGANPAPVLIISVTILLIAAGVGGYRAFASSRAERASAQLADLHDQLVLAMGGKVTDAEIPEPANRETARKVRTDFADRYQTVAQQWKGTPAGALALLEAGRLYVKLGNQDRALEVWTDAIGSLPRDSAELGILYTSIAHLQEQKNDPEGAAKSYDSAAAVPGFPLYGSALVDAARCWAQAGKPEQALAAYHRLKAELPEFAVPPYVESEIQELEQKSAAAPVAAPAANPPAAPATPAPPAKP
jgi:tetratricopeptide (TPR) repeat protein